MRKLLFLTAGASLLAFGPSYASDHLFSAVRAGGLTTSSQPVQNGTNNRGRPGDLVPGQGSPLSGVDHTTPAAESGSLLTHRFTQPNLNANLGNGMLRTPLPVTRGQLAPSAHSPH